MLRIAAVIVVAVAASGCLNPTAPDAVVNKPFQLKAGESITLPDGNWVRFNRLVSDSRCPMDVMCVVAGDAVISVSFKAGHLTTELHTDPSKSQISTSKYLLKLTELQPYPRASSPSKPEDYVGTFVVQNQ